MCAIQLHLVWIEDVIDVDERLLAVKHVYCRIVRNRVSRTIDELLLVLHLFENHGSDILLLVSFCFSPRYFQFLNHLKLRIEVILDVPTDVFETEFETRDLGALGLKLLNDFKLRTSKPSFIGFDFLILSQLSFWTHLKYFLVYKIKVCSVKLFQI